MAEVTSSGLPAGRAHSRDRLCVRVSKRKLAECAVRFHAGHLSVIEMAGTGGDWRMVRELILDQLEASCPVVYTQCGDIGSYASGEDLRARYAGSALHIVDDQDLLVRYPSLGGPREQLDLAGGPGPYYECHIPTLLRMRSEVAQHEARYGKSLVVLDEVFWARPYIKADPDPAIWGGELSLGLTTEQVAKWRALDIHEFATGRDGPTVAIWDGGGHPGLDELKALSTLYVRSWIEDKVSYVSVQRRDAIADCWTELSAKYARPIAEDVAS